MLYICILTGILITEHLVKNYFEANYDSRKQERILKNRILLRKYHNYGAFLNIMETKRKLLHLISIVFTIIIFLMFVATIGHKGNRILKLGLTLLLGGAFSNTYDRLSRGYVVDYFSFLTPFPKLNRIVFNISDFCILIGTLLTVLGSGT